MDTSNQNSSFIDSNQGKERAKKKKKNENRQGRIESFDALLFF
jgi:hypothetical protein